eukprot:scaffold60930_cov68-Phaeocystis_antarctica.AAC.2
MRGSPPIRIPVAVHVRRLGGRRRRQPGGLALPLQLLLGAPLRPLVRLLLALPPQEGVLLEELLHDGRLARRLRTGCPGVACCGRARLQRLGQLIDALGEAAALVAARHLAAGTSLVQDERLQVDAARGVARARVPHGAVLAARRRGAQKDRHRLPPTLRGLDGVECRAQPARRHEALEVRGDRVVAVRVPVHLREGRPPLGSAYR